MSEAGGGAGVGAAIPEGAVPQEDGAGEQTAATLGVALEAGASSAAEEFPEGAGSVENVGSAVGEEEPRPPDASGSSCGETGSGGSPSPQKGSGGADISELQLSSAGTESPAAAGRGDVFDGLYQRAEESRRQALYRQARAIDEALGLSSSIETGEYRRAAGASGASGASGLSGGSGAAAGRPGRSLLSGVVSSRPAGSRDVPGPRLKRRMGESYEAFCSRARAARALRGVDHSGVCLGCGAVRCVCGRGGAAEQTEGLEVPTASGHEAGGVSGVQRVKGERITPDSRCLRDSRERRDSRGSPRPPGSPTPQEVDPAGERRGSSPDDPRGEALTIEDLRGDGPEPAAEGERPCREPLAGSAGQQGDRPADGPVGRPVDREAGYRAGPRSARSGRRQNGQPPGPSHASCVSYASRASHASHPSPRNPSSFRSSARPRELREPYEPAEVKSHWVFPSPTLFAPSAARAADSAAGASGGGRENLGDRDAVYSYVLTSLSKILEASD